jgi:ribokinase
MILVFGSINVDLIVPVPHLPRQGETVLGGDYRLLPGGKGGNQALAARRSGSEVILAGAVGADSFAGIALDRLRREGVETRLVRIAEQPTGCAAVMVSRDGENAIAVAPGANTSVRSEQVPDELLGPGTIVVAQMEIPPGETAILMRRARARGGRNLLNLAPAMPFDLGVLENIDLLVANEGEVATLGPNPERVARRLRRGWSSPAAPPEQSAFLPMGRIEVPVLPIVPIDTTGAGDTFIGVLAAALDLGATLETALRRASAGAGLACLAPGAQMAMPDAAEIDRAMARLPPS